MASVLMQIEVVQTLQNMLLVEIGLLRTVNRGRLIRFIMAMISHYLMTSYSTCLLIKMDSLH